MNIIQTNKLTKSYGVFTAVNEINITIKKGEIYGLLGPNGAGKSTLMKILLGLTTPTNGTFEINGYTYPKDRNKILSIIGSLIEEPAFYGNLTGKENLEIIRRILKLPQSSVEEALDLVDLTEFKDRKANNYSLGMKQRLGIASAIIGAPPILILDEPTNGLDPVGVHEIRNLIKTLPDKLDTTVIVSSHLLSEIELMSDRLGILNRGKLLFEGEIKELQNYMKELGYRTGNLEETFLSLISSDNSMRGIQNEN
ncbi:ATP-binding cassette domain-containing protein [Ruoffia tabacinasalis]|uniref:ATP-binding cassette domain-containing protein n=1 Tax=Ruoffia tabacinasalis TaxID=87458 RepID=A0A5R9E095_9LACT|nr:ATP-binding cassette domain-containing protein [Ruoffia tabacinasalis]TLQ41755.1 ATP-binding cassette domain-containing protein [Ruoffia tabacinasalis]